MTRDELQRLIDIIVEELAAAGTGASGHGPMQLSRRAQ